MDMAGQPDFLPVSRHQRHRIPTWITVCVIFVTALFMIIISIQSLPKFRDRWLDLGCGQRTPVSFNATFQGDSDEVWRRLVPENGGLIDTHSTYFRDHHHGIKAPKAFDLVGISMFHQLHCLQLVRKSIKQMLRKTKDATESHQQEHTLHGHEEFNPHSNRMGIQDDHLLHCLDYIAQVNSFYLFTVFEEDIETI
jgi:hypothetical protein